ncbi:GNAT family N-acetyltransferase [Nodosilinea sp. LEGE 06152]|uniref:GNAT family N-acetyltransferase n=1 Tax=Nodosilinea sp. LEGE 06152 TaxID=2777966 RepID=UPI001882398C|nr:GNAT family N-acetyltransferase [Nodosilinea sp. LEGE 06152]MBE9155961.1 GNAT family N-acetyltransferase [Nodosilinea sp. LEGE 06152]
MQANFTIRTARPEDRPVLVTLMELLQDAEHELHLNRSLGAEIGDAHFAYLEELVREQNGQIYVAESKEGILGFVVCFVEKYDEGDLHVVESEREYGYISDLYVVSTMRKRGVAAALMQAAERHFLNLNLKVVRVGLLCSNEPAAKFYRKAGYQPYEILYEKRFNE